MKNQLAKLSSFKSWYFFVLLISIFVLYTCRSSKSGAVDLVFALGPEDGGTMQPLIDKFNEEYDGRIKVTWKQTSRLTDEFFQEIAAGMTSGDPGFDVFGSDVIWTATLANNEWVEDITATFFEIHNPQDFIEGAMESVSYQFKIWGVPWYTDAGMFYYRKDLLEKSGYQRPPATWEEVIAMSKKIMKDSGTKYGYVFQGAEYEGGVTNACEFIWNADGNVLFGDLYASSSFDQAAIDPEVITVNSPQSIEGLSTLQKIMQSGIVPENIREYKEREASEAFRNGEAVFMRNWASSYGSLLSAEAKIKPGQIGLTPLPTNRPELVPYSCLGGWNLMIRAGLSEEKKAGAWEFINYLTSEGAQKYRAINGGILPGLRSLYTDESFLKEAPVADFARQVIPVSKKRPQSPYYMEMSPEIASIYVQLLEGKLKPEIAAEVLQKRLEDIIKKHQ